MSYDFLGANDGEHTIPASRCSIQVPKYERSRQVGEKRRTCRLFNPVEKWTYRLASKSVALWVPQSEEEKPMTETKLIEARIIRRLLNRAYHSDCCGHSLRVCTGKLSARVALGRTGGWFGTGPRVLVIN